MEENKKIRLCPGTFLTLLMKAKKDVATAHEKEKGISYENSDDDVFEALIGTAFDGFTVSNKSSFHTFTNTYKQCKKECAKSIPLADESAVSCFKTNSNSVGFCLHMQEFLKTYIKESELIWLVNALILLIENDDNISDERIWLTAANFPREKSTLRVIDDIYVDWFVASVWAYTILRCKRNKIDKDIYNQWVAELDARMETDNNRESWTEFNINWFETPFYKVELGATMEIAPELAPDKEIFILERYTEPEKTIVERYLDNVYENNHTVQTFYYEQKAEFSEFYVRNDLARKIGNFSCYHYESVDNSSAVSIAKRSKYSVITGTGGLGKSMIMHYFLLQAVDDYKKDGLLPLFVRLKDYVSSETDLFKYLYDEFDALCEGEMSEEEFSGMLKNGQFILLLDGMDEIQISSRLSFEKEMNRFAKVYKENIIIISSRQNNSFRGLGNQFEELELRPFSKDQAIDMIKKLDFSREEVKARFLEKLDTEYFRTHKSFAENPLLLTIMLTTFAAFGRINSDAQKVHLFYEEAFVALAQKHDANKMGGAVNREFSTGFSTNRLAEYMARFCANSYMERKTNYTKMEFDYYFNAAKRRIGTKSEEEISADDFLYDLQNNVCLIYPENLKYEYTHRSFQEYFCAKFFYENAFDDQLYDIGLELEKRGKKNGDLTFRMLYDMNPKQIEAFILLPFLEDLFNECDQDAGFETFLERVYPTIYYCVGDLDGDGSCNEPESFLFDFIVSVYNLTEALDEYDNRFEVYEEFIEDEYVDIHREWYGEDGYEYYGVVRRDDVDPDYFYMHGEEETCGYSCSFSTQEVFAKKEKYSDIIETLYDEKLPLMKQYNHARALMETFREEKNSRNKKKNFMDMF